VGHIGEVIVDQEFAERNRKFKWDEWNPLPAISDGSPIVSITIPVYNQRLDFLKASILSAAHQTVPTEVIVVDDGSTPPLREQPEFMEWWDDLQREVADAAETPEEAEAMKNRLQLITYVKSDGSPDHRNKGISTALNAGIRAMDAKVQYWCWLSSDDLFMPDKCKEQLAAIVQMQAKASYTRWQALLPGTPHPSIAEFYQWSNIREQMAWLSQACVINGSTVMLHRSIFDEIGLFDESIKYGQDWDLWCRVGICHYWAPVREIYTSRRQEGNLTAKIEQSPEMKSERDREDTRIRSQYAAYRPKGV
jgi:GT2 family glycosyltransferase